MENLLHSVVCPNCGANATNLHNCEYCGSFLVQRAAEGRDVSEYVRASSKYSNRGLASAIKVYSDFLQQHPEEKELFFHVNFGSRLFFNLEPTNTGFALTTHSFTISEKNDELRFRNSPLIQAFKMEEFITTDVNGNNTHRATCYSADFGYDYDGAAKLILQLMETLDVKANEVEFNIYDTSLLDAEVICDFYTAEQIESSGIDLNDPDFNSSVVKFNSDGVIIADPGCFMSKGYQVIIEKRQRADKKLEPLYNKKAQGEVNWKNFIIISIIGWGIIILGGLLLNL